MNKIQVIVGERYGRLLVISEAFQIEGRRVVECKCDCGSLRTVRVDHLRRGHTSSCGCAQRDAAKTTGHATATHGMSSSPTYEVWDRMKQRCMNSAHTQYHHYGARGISICDRWLSFEAFLCDMGECPDGMSIDRFPDNNGNYEPGNCRWATQTQQCRNKRNNRLITIEGETLCLVEWAERAGITQDRIRGRLRLGWTPQQAVYGKGRFHVD